MAGRRKKIGALPLILVLSLILAHFQAVSATTINKAKDKKEKAQAELNEANRQIEEIEQQRAALMSEIDQKDAQLVDLLVSIGILEDELADKNAQFEQVTADLAAAEASEAEQYAAMKKRIQFMYERGDTAMLESLLHSADISDFLNRVEYVSDIYQYDRNLLAQYRTTAEQVASLKVTVETEMAEMEAMKSECAEQKASLETILAEKRSQVGDYDSQIASAEAAAKKYKSMIAKQNAIIKEEERKQREAEEAARAAALAKANEAKANEQNMANVSGEAAGIGANPAFATNISGSSVVSYACQFIGNPYVWGGTSLTNGADCSGFVMSVFDNFGINLPHSSAALQSCGKAVSYANAQPGDLICYSGHVGIYMGGGRIVHAQSSAVGITTSPATYRTIVAVRRVL